MLKHLLLLPITMLLAGAWVQNAGPAGFDPAKPTAIDAERSEWFDGGSRIILEEGVQISQPGIILTADQMEIEFVPGTQEIKQLTAIGRVRYATADGNAIAGDRALYSGSEALLTVTGNVVVVQQTQVATGDQLIYNTETGAIRMTGGEEGRVRALITPQEGV